MASIKDAKPNQNITLDAVTISEKGPVREVSMNGRLVKVCTCKVKDASGELELSLWDAEVEQYEKGDALSLTDGWCKEWNGKLQASKGRSGKLAKK